MNKRIIFFFTCITCALFSATDAFAATVQNFETIRAGYKDGFFMATEDERFKVKFGSRVNFLYNYRLLDAQSDQSRFDLPHAKFYFGGNLFGDNVHYFFQAAAGHDTQVGPRYLPVAESHDGSFVLEDYYVRLKWNQTYFQLGQFRVPFTRQSMIYSSNLQMLRRSLATNAITFDRDKGLTISQYRRTFWFTLGAFNGAGLYQLDRGAVGQQNQSNDVTNGRGHLYVARFVALPMGGRSGYTEGDVDQSEGQRLEIGAGFAFDHDRDIDTNFDSVADDTQANIMALSGDISWKHQGKSLQGEFFYRKVFDAAFADTDSLGFYIQPGYFITPSQIELALRYSMLDPNTEVSDDRIFELGGGFNFYFAKSHRQKLQLHYTQVRTQSPLASTAKDQYFELGLQFTL